MVWTAIAAFFIAFLLGSLIGILRTLPNKPLSFIGTCYVELFRKYPADRTTIFLGIRIPTITTTQLKYW